MASFVSRSLWRCSGSKSNWAERPARMAGVAPRSRRYQYALVTQRLSEVEVIDSLSRLISFTLASICRLNYILSLWFRSQIRPRQNQTAPNPASREWWAYPASRPAQYHHHHGAHTKGQCANVYFSSFKDTSSLASHETRKSAIARNSHVFLSSPTRPTTSPSGGQAPR